MMSVIEGIRDHEGLRKFTGYWSKIRLVTSKDTEVGGTGDDLDTDQE